MRGAGRAWRTGMSGWGSVAPVPFNDAPWLWEPVRVSGSGRYEVRCARCGNLFWLTLDQLEAVVFCGHCLHWGLRGWQVTNAASQMDD
jgi:hypothetical protein